MTIKINLNADMAEGFGAYDIGDDSGILKIIGSANIACGFHAGDPTDHAPGDHRGQGERRHHRRASRLQRSLGFRPPPHRHAARRSRIHGRLPDRRAAGDGDLCRRQGHASQAARRAEQHGGRGSANMRWRSAAPSRPSIPASSMSRWPARRWKRPAASSGCRSRVEGFCDRQYDDDGNLTSRKIPGSVLKDAGRGDPAGDRHGRRTTSSPRATARRSPARCTRSAFTATSRPASRPRARCARGSKRPASSWCRSPKCRSTERRITIPVGSRP